MTTTRMNILLLHLDLENFRSPPKGVGYGTVVRARELGFIEVEGRGIRARCKLTPLGKGIRLRRKPVQLPKNDENQ